MKDFSFFFLFSIYSLIIPINLTGQNSDLYLELTETPRLYNETIGAFDNKSNLFVCGMYNNPSGIPLYKIDSNRKVIKTIQIPCGQKGLPCVPNDILIIKDTLIITLEQVTNSNISSIRIVTLTTNFKILLDTTYIDTSNWSSHTPIKININNQNELIITSYVRGKFSDSTNHLAIYRMNKSGQITQTKRIYEAGHGVSVSNFKNNKYLISTNEYIDSNGIRQGLVAMVIDSALNVEKLIKTDTSSLSYTNKIGNKFILYSPAFRGFTSTIPLKNNKIAVISGFEIDTNYILKFPIKSVRSYHMRVALTNLNDSLHSEHIISDSSGNPIVSGFRNSAQFDNGSFLAFGETNGSDGWSPFLHIRSSYSLSKFDAYGKFMWSKRYSNKNFFYQASQVAISNQNKIALIGMAYDYTNTTLNYGYVLFLDSNGNEIKTVNLNEYNLQNNRVQVFPNPAKNQITFKSELVKSNLKITNASGVLVFEKQIGKTEEIDVSPFPTGIYFYSLSSQNQITTGKFVKVR